MIRLKLMLYFMFMAVASLVSPATGLQVIYDEKRCQARRKRLAGSIAAVARVGDRV